jgi:hypothetical protein
MNERERERDREKRERGEATLAPRGLEVELEVLQAEVEPRHTRDCGMHGGMEMDCGLTTGAYRLHRGVV